MSAGDLFKPHWFDGAHAVRRDLWRGVEAQHQVATMRLVDDLDEQHLLELVLDDSKPPQPPPCRGLHYLLATPFRYCPPFASRFRLPEHPGAWYGAQEPQTVAAEVAYWRWRHFFMQSDGLRDRELVTQHTFFLAQFNGIELDLTREPWSRHRAQWRHPDDYSACHALASHVRDAHPDIRAIRYESARREGGTCEVVMHPKALSLPRVHRQQTWVCKTTRARVLLVHGTDKLQFEMSGADLAARAETAAARRSRHGTGSPPARG